MVDDCNWRLEAISKAAKNRKKSSFILKAGENTVGKKKDSYIKIPSVLCSREHCIIRLDGDKVTLTDMSRNGTYITFSRETKHYLNATTDVPLEQNDMISFGFNTASVYDVNDKNAFIYRLVKEQIETIDIDDSDEEQTIVKDKIIDIDNRVIDIDSDSASNYSGEECLQNIDELKDEIDDEQSANSSIQCESSSDIYSDSVNSSIECDDDDNFVIRKTIHNVGTPDETIALDDDDDDDDDEEDEEGHDNDNEDKSPQSENSNDKVSNGSNEKPVQDNNVQSTNDDKHKPNDGTKMREKSSFEIQQIPKTSENMQNAKKRAADDSETNTNDNQPSTSDQQSNTSSVSAKLEDWSRRMKATQVSNAPKIIKAQPLRKRRRRPTITEDEYRQKKQTNQIKSEMLKERRAKLASIGENQLNKKIKAAENAGPSNRVPFVAKVKNQNASRNELLLTDILSHHLA